MDKKILQQEKDYLNVVLKEIDKIKAVDVKKSNDNLENIAKLKKYFSDYYYEILAGAGTDEFASINVQIEQLEKQNDFYQTEIKRLTKQKKNPYFGRFDFAEKNSESKPYYIGLGHVKNDKDQNFVFDWRADICSLYYDDKIGKTSYSCPEGEISGELTLKRQYKIENNNLSYYVDSNMVIDDEILMEQLSKHATAKMHEIVSTIQKEQNLLIRADDFKNTIVQGVAGSGKTSIAMHRVSYLLYKYRDKLKSEDILILSPSQSFSNYISQVLPSLGEDSSFTTTFTEMAKRLLGENFESREVMLEKIIGKGSQQDFENIAIKSSFEFLLHLKKFLKKDLGNLFVPHNMTFGNVSISKEEIREIYFEKLPSLEIHKRIDLLAEFISEKFKIPKNRRFDLTKRAKKLLYAQFLTTDLLKIYNLFLRSIDLPEVEKIGAYDVAPILLIKENLFSLKSTYDAKYVIIDEMQDYTPCHFYLFDKIWSCGKLYLGDIYQSIDRTLTPEYLTSLARLTKSRIKYLKKSYRSTLQISLFTQKILGKRIANNVNRKGEEVKCIRTKNCAKKIEEILETTEKTQNVAVICKTNDQIKELQAKSLILKKFKHLNKEKSTNIKHIITTPAEAKGVEFDCVIVPFANDENYKNELDRNLLYVSSTRALHSLYFLSDKKPSRFLLKRN